MLFYSTTAIRKKPFASPSDILTSRKQAGQRPAENTRLCNPANRLIIALEFVPFRRPSACTTALRKARRKKRAVSNVKKRGRFACKSVTGARFSETPSVSRGFSPCLTFWYFWVKPKVRRKTVADFLSAQRLGSCSASFVPQVFLALSFEERAKEDREAKMIGKRTASR